jgi:4-amino-4-deoxy-L-arabinose transferase-like glycosyltransferase
VTASLEERRVLLLTALALAALTALRLAGLLALRVQLDFEEAQYWAWGQHFAWGYFSKPPLIGWIMGFSDAVCGGSEPCLRTPSVLLHAGTAWLVGAVAARLYGPGLRFWAALLFTLAPGVSFSTRLMTTDVPLLFFWALTLLALLRLAQRGRLSDAVLLGLAVGFGLLAKYAMAYFVGCALLWVATDREGRRALFSRNGMVALVVALLVFLPNLVWNVFHGLQTFAHTGDNIAGTGFQVSPLRALGFLAAQIGIAVPGVALLALFRVGGFGRTAATGSADRFLLAFFLPILVGMTAYGLFVRVNANWAAPAHVAMAACGVAVTTRLRFGRPLLAAGVVYGLAVQALLIAGDALADRLSLPFVPGREPYARQRGWAELAGSIAAEGQRLGVRGIAVEGRRDTALMTYYLRDTGWPVLTWPHGKRPSNHFEATVPLTSASPMPVLLVTECPATARYADAFGAVGPALAVVSPTGATSRRARTLVRLDKPRPVLPPLGGCE